MRLNLGILDRSWSHLHHRRNHRVHNSRRSRSSLQFFGSHMSLYRKEVGTFLGQTLGYSGSPDCYRPGVGLFASCCGSEKVRSLKVWFLGCHHRDAPGDHLRSAFRHHYRRIPRCDFWRNHRRQRSLKCAQGWMGSFCRDYGRYAPETNPCRYHDLLFLQSPVLIW